jgi:leucyl/phenylalanyl-tRNA---protein transferase
VRSSPTYFPDPRLAGPEGYLGSSARITSDLLLDAYGHGIFPWSDWPARWYSPDPRAIFDLTALRFARRLARVVRQGRFQVTFDTAFSRVMLECMRHHSRESWISSPMVAAYSEFHRLGYAHSVEVWREDRLVGGLYGVQLGRFFAGESMFHREADASKVGFVYLVEKLRDLGVQLFDSQVLSEHTASLGAVEISRDDYLSRLDSALAEGPCPVDWRELDASEGW